MSEIQMNQQILSILQNCKNAQQVISMAKTKGLNLSEEQAGKIFEMFQNDRLSDDVLEKVTGGQSYPTRYCLSGCYSDGKL